MSEIIFKVYCKQCKFFDGICQCSVPTREDDWHSVNHKTITYHNTKEKNQNNDCNDFIVAKLPFWSKFFDRC